MDYEQFEYKIKIPFLKWSSHVNQWMIDHFGKRKQHNNNCWVYFFGKNVSLHYTSHNYILYFKYEEDLIMFLLSNNVVC